MNEVLVPVFVAAATSAVGLGFAWLGARALQRLGLGDAQQTVNKSLRELAETEKAKRELAEEEHTRAREAWATERAALVLERDHYQREADDAVRRLDMAYAEMRATGRLTDRRRLPRDEPRSGGDAA